MGKGKNREVKGGLVFGKRGGKRMKAAKAAIGAPITTKHKVDRGFAKKAKRRALRTVEIPEELKDGGKRKNKKLLIAVAMADHQLSKELVQLGGMETA